MFNQKDEGWASLTIGDSPYLMRGYGCLTTDLAQALALSGYAVTPGSVVTALSAGNGYTDRHYKETSTGSADGLSGLLLWMNVSRSYPQVTMYLHDGGAYAFIQVIASYQFGRFEHWVLRVNGIYYDPIDGTTSPVLKSNYRPTGDVKSADISPFVPPVIPESTGQVNADIPVTRLFDVERTVQVTGTGTVGLNCRTEPTPASALFKVLPEGSSYFVKGYRHGESVNGNDVWYLTRNDHWFSAFYTNQPNI